MDNERRPTAGVISARRLRLSSSSVAASKHDERIGGDDALSFCTNEQWIDVDLVDAISVIADHPGEVHDRQNKGIDVARRCAAVTLENFCAFQLAEHLPCVFHGKRREPMCHIVYLLDPYAPETDHHVRSKMLVVDGAQDHF